MTQLVDSLLVLGGALLVAFVWGMIMALQAWGLSLMINFLFKSSITAKE